MYVDPDGEWFWIAGMIIGAVAANWGKDLSRPNMLGETLLGAAIGAAAGAGLDYVAANAGLSVKIAADLPYVGQVNLASMDFVGPGLVAAAGAAARGREQFRQEQSESYRRAGEMADEFDVYSQTGAVQESDFCYPCGGDFEGEYDSEVGGVYFLNGRPVGEKSLEDSVSPIDVFLVGRSVYNGVNGLFRVWGKQGERRFAMGLSNGHQFFRLDKHAVKGWHYHRWPDMSKHRPKEGGF
jgi:hypothetical protein